MQKMHKYLSSDLEIVNALFSEFFIPTSFITAELAAWRAISLKPFSRSFSRQMSLVSLSIGYRQH